MKARMVVIAAMCLLATGCTLTLLQVPVQTPLFSGLIRVDGSLSVPLVADAWDWTTNKVLGSASSELSGKDREALLLKLALERRSPTEAELIEILRRERAQDLIDMLGNRMDAPPGAM